MRTLQQITDAVRRNEEVTDNELRYSICAYDVLLNQMNLSKNYQDLKIFMVAAEMNPKEFIGPANDFKNPNVVKWHKSTINIEQQIKEINNEELKP